MRSFQALRIDVDRYRESRPNSRYVKGLMSSPYLSALPMINAPMPKTPMTASHDGYPKMLSMNK